MTNRHFHQPQSLETRLAFSEKCCIFRNGCCQNKTGAIWLGEETHISQYFPKLPWLMSEASNTAENLVRVIDQQLLGVLRLTPKSTVNSLAITLEVTATAVRQRLERLLEAGLIDREKISGAGRGRPTFKYSLSSSGLRVAGADYGALAEAMWLEILEIPDLRVRRNLLRRIALRIGRQYAERIHAAAPFSERLQQLSQILTEQKIPAMVEGSSDLPILDVHVCPYPDLATADLKREMCHLEEEMLSEAMGQPIHLSRCRLDGDTCCQFTPKST